MKRLIAALVLMALAWQSAWGGSPEHPAGGAVPRVAASTPVLVKDINRVTAAVNDLPPYGYSSISAGVLFFATDAVHHEGGLYKASAATGAIELLHGEYAPNFWGTVAGCPAVLNDTLYYLTEGTGYYERDLWRSDGTRAGTSRVATLTASDFDRGSQCLYPFGDHLLFVAADGEHGWELWHSDGTAAGTELLKDINPGQGDSNPGGFVTMGGEVFFTANGKLWKTDGTTGGTVLAADLGAGALKVLGDRLFFSSDDGVHGAELWVTDGTATGAHMVKDIRPGPSGSLWQLEGGYRMGDAGGRVLFPAQDDTHGMEIWASDGTEPGTVLLEDLSSGSGWGVERYVPFGMAGGKAYFLTESGFWKTDGTGAGTARVSNLGAGWLFGYEPPPMAGVGAVMYFRAAGELYRTDGSTGGTSRVKDIHPSGDSKPTALTNADGTLYFSAFDPANGMQPWRSDGTEAGTVMLGSVTSSAGNSDPADLFEYKGMAFFEANDGTHGRELWRSDGTADGTVLVHDIAPGSASALPQVDPFGQVLGSSGRAVAGGILYFVADDGTHGRELWRSDGTEAGTQMVKDISADSGDSDPRLLTPYQGLLYFFAYDGTTDWIYKSDGTDDGTVPVKRMGGGPAALVVSDTLFFEGSDGQVGAGLWKSDGTAEGTVLLRHLNLRYPTSGQASFVGAGGILYFLAEASQGSSGLYRSDGTGYGTWQVKELQGVDLGSVGLTVVNDQIYFGVEGEWAAGNELWTSDGTAAGTVMVKDIWPGRGSSQPAGLRGAGGVLYFWADDGVHGRELWRSDGTTAGTQLVRDLSPGPGHSEPTEAQLGPLVFSGADGNSGDEAWEIGYAADGVRRLADIVPGPGGSYPRGFAIAGSRLFFSAFTVEAGRELWSVPVYAIAGTVTGDRVPAARVQVSDGSGHLVMTDRHGRYRFDEVIEGDYTVTPELFNYSFTPPMCQVTVPPGATCPDIQGTPLVSMYLPLMGRP